jgi:hypothetical protein
VPELLMPVNTNGSPQSAVWHVGLSGPTLVHDVKSGNLQVSDLYVGLADVTQHGLAQFVAPVSQPTGTTLRWSPPPQPGEQFDAYNERIGANINSTTILRRSDTPLQFEATSTAGGTQ